jgi:uncharacterized protein (DUF1501 family)
MPDQRYSTHAVEHAAAAGRSLLHPAPCDLIRVGSRRWFLQTGLAGIAGLSLPDLLRARAQAAPAQQASRKAVILFWLSGGPSHLDTWDPKPDAPAETRGPFATIPTKVPGVRLCEHLPLQASILDRLAILRAMDCRDSVDHHPAVMQSGNSAAWKDLKPSAAGPLVGRYPSMGAFAARFRGANDAEMPAFVGMADPSLSLWHADVWGAGHLGAAYEPVAERDLLGRLELARGVSIAGAQDRDGLLKQLDGLRRDVDTGQTMERMDHFGRQALSMVLSGKARAALQIDKETDTVRDAYGRDSFGEKALLARRLVEAGVTFVTISGRFGVFDNHGDDVVWGGLIKGLKPLFPSVDRSLYALVRDLESRGLLESTLVLMLGEFGRSPQISKTGGRTHWPNCMSVLVAGGGLTHGQVIGGTDRWGGEINDGRVTPADLAATVYQHLDIDLTHQWTDFQGRPHAMVADGGRPIRELG